MMSEFIGADVLKKSLFSSIYTIKKKEKYGS